MHHTDEAFKAKSLSGRLSRGWTEAADSRHPESLYYLRPCSLPTSTGEDLEDEDSHATSSTLFTKPSCSEQRPVRETNDQAAVATELFLRWASELFSHFWIQKNNINPSELQGRGKIKNNRIVIDRESYCFLVHVEP